jgi:hypothetical protein
MGWRCGDDAAGAMAPNFGFVDAHRRLRVWQDARRFAALIYSLTDQLPTNERFVATAQFRRAALVGTQQYRRRKCQVRPWRDAEILRFGDR